MAVGGKNLGSRRGSSRERERTRLGFRDVTSGNVPRGVDDDFLPDVGERPDPDRAQVPFEHRPVPDAHAHREVRVPDEHGVGREPRVGAGARDPVAQRDLLAAPVVHLVLDVVPRGPGAAGGCKRPRDGDGRVEAMARVLADYPTSSLGERARADA